MTTRLDAIDLLDDSEEDGDKSAAQKRKGDAAIGAARRAPAKKKAVSKVSKLSKLRQLVQRRLDGLDSTQLINIIERLLNDDANAAAMAKMPEFSALEVWRKCAACKERFHMNNNFNDAACVVKHPEFDSYYGPSKDQCPKCRGCDGWCNFCVRCGDTLLHFICYLFLQ